MSQKKTKAASGGKVIAYAFGDDVGVLDGSMWGFFEGSWICGEWYEPPVPFRALARCYRMSPHHQSAISLKVNQLSRHFIPSRWLTAEQHDRAVLDFLQMGNLFLQEIPNMARRPLRYEVSPALNTRVGVEAGRYFWVKPDEHSFGSAPGDYEFPPDSVVHLRQHDVEQEIYGLPGWLSAMQSGLLNESATLFRRRYYLNGGHAGYILLVTDATISDDDFELIKQQISSAKGRNNFKNLAIHNPGGKEEGLKLIPISEVAAKDDFDKIKNVSRDDILAAHRVPPQLLGVVPTNNGGFGDVLTANDMFFYNEIYAIMTAMRRINDITGLPVVDYQPYEPMRSANAAAA